MWSLNAGIFTTKAELMVYAGKRPSKRCPSCGCLVHADAFHEQEGLTTFYVGESVLGWDKANHAGNMVSPTPMDLTWWRSSSSLYTQWWQYCCECNLIVRWVDSPKQNNLLQNDTGSLWHLDIDWSIWFSRMIVLSSNASAMKSEDRLFKYSKSFSISASCAWKDLLELPSLPMEDSSYSIPTL